MRADERAGDLRLVARVEELRVFFAALRRDDLAAVVRVRADVRLVVRLLLRFADDDLRAVARDFFDAALDRDFVFIGEEFCKGGVD